MQEQGGNYLEIGRFEPSSKMCGCGEINKELKLSDRVWTCSKCGIENNRDFLAANNILKFGLQKQNLLTAGTVGRASGDVGISRIYEGGTIVSA
jgi:transposase